VPGKPVPGKSERTSTHPRIAEVLAVFVLIEQSVRRHRTKTKTETETGAPHRPRLRVDDCASAAADDDRASTATSD
jgi:hypothetical protein